MPSVVKLMKERNQRRHLIDKIILFSIFHGYTLTRAAYVCAGVIQDGRRCNTTELSYRDR